MTFRRPRAGGGFFLALLLLPFVLPASARQRSLVGGQEARPNPCASRQDSRALDVWVGEWDVRTPEVTKVADSHVRRAEGGCLLIESYAQADGYTGRSFNFYDAALRRWRQTWVDSAGNVSEFAGEYREGAMRFEGESHRRGGGTLLRRMHIFNLGADEVRQFSEASTDGGKSWAVLYDFNYKRKRPTPR